MTCPGCKRDTYDPARGCSSSACQLHPRNRDKRKPRRKWRRRQATHKEI